MAKPVVLKFHRVVFDAIRTATRIKEGECWLDDRYSLILTAEEKVNLLALVEKYPDLAVTEEELDQRTVEV